MPMEHVDVAVVGGGVTGLAVAIAVAERGRSVCLLERHPRPGMESSTHNSGVIHAGIYYEQGSLRATLCVEGRDRLYTFRRAHDVPHERCGKLIVALASNETARLHELARCARANGVDDVERVGRDFVRRRTPHVEAMAALWSPSTGIVEAEALVRALARRAAELDVMLLPGTRLEHGTPSAAGVDVVTSSETFSAGLLVNAAGLYADDVSAAVGGRTVRDSAGAWRVCGAGASPALHGEHSGLSCARPVGLQSACPSHTHHLGERDDRSHRAIHVDQGRP